MVTHRRKRWEGVRSILTPFSLPLLGYDVADSTACEESGMGFTEKLATGKFRARWFDPTGV